MAKATSVVVMKISMSHKTNLLRIGILYGALIVLHAVATLWNYYEHQFMSLGAVLFFSIRTFIVLGIWVLITSRLRTMRGSLDFIVLVVLAFYFWLSTPIRF